jgi:hypothetical protein
VKFIALAAALSAALPAFAAAQAAGPDPAANVPPPTYRSAFQDLPTGVVDEVLDWKNANADVARFPRGHGDWLKWEERAGAGPQPARSSAPEAAGGSAPASTALPAGHRHRGRAP